MGLTNTGQPELACWEFAGLLLTYWCNARCAFCYVFGGPNRGGEMPVERALSGRLDRRRPRQDHARAPAEASRSALAAAAGNTAKAREAS